MTLEEYYIQANQDHNDFINRSPTDRTLLEEFLFLHKRIAFFERRYELLKQVILDKDITGESDGLELKRHKSTKFTYNTDEDLVKELVELKEKVKSTEAKVKLLTSTDKKITITTKVESK